MNLKILVQDKDGYVKEELVVDVSDDMTKGGLVDALRDSGVIDSKSYNVLLPLGESDSLFFPRLIDGSTVIVREHKSRFRILRRGDDDD